MSEAIKVPRFRGKRVADGVWVYGWYYERNGRPTIINDEKVALCDFAEIHPTSLGMSTGLFDRHGKEIFGSLEGSRGGDRARAEPGVEGEIVWWNAAWCWTDGACHWFLINPSSDNQPDENKQPNCYELEITGKAAYDLEGK